MIKFEKLKADILMKIPAVRNVLAEDSRVIFGYLFGGLAAGRVSPLSDVDIAVYARDVSGLASYKLLLFEKLSDALGTAELDLVILNTSPISLAGRILQSGQLLIDKNPFKRHAYESLTRREFFDFRIQEDAFFARRYGIGR
ncbi:MAG TPA: nucleotidyltransferase domain-containing protein [Nitrospirota bacterium]